MKLYFPAFFYYVDKCIFHITGEGRNQGICLFVSDDPGPARQGLHRFVYLSVSEAY